MAPRRRLAPPTDTSGRHEGDQRHSDGTPIGAWSAESMASAIEEVSLAIDRYGEFKFEIDPNPIWDHIRPYTRELAALTYLKPTLMKDLAGLHALSHPGIKSFCSICHAFDRPTRATQTEEQTDYPVLTLDVAYQTVAAPATPSTPGTSDNEPVLLHGRQPVKAEPTSDATTRSDPYLAVPTQRPAAPPPSPRPVAAVNRDRSPCQSSPEDRIDHTSGPRYGRCFNCGSADHHKKECTISRQTHCYRCGYPHVTVRECPLHGRAWRAAGPYVDWLHRNVPRDEILRRGEEPFSQRRGYDDPN